ncbi:MAG: hypothetical protein U1D96_05415 [Eubacteriales bacterium]|nr:hypothetical protein [Clostridia bacterium]MDZ4042919.1 hypothetical protein [Eubacteriales bacterium]
MLESIILFFLFFFALGAAIGLVAAIIRCGILGLFWVLLVAPVKLIGATIKGIRESRTAIPLKLEQQKQLLEKDRQRWDAAANKLTTKLDKSTAAIRAHTERTKSRFRQQ